MAIQKVITTTLDKTVEIAQKTLKQKKTSYPYVGAGTFFPTPRVKMQTTHPYFSPTTPVEMKENKIGQIIDFFAF